VPRGGIEKTGISKDTLSRLLNVLTNVVVKDGMGVCRFSDSVYRYATERLSSTSKADQWLEWWRE